MPAWRSPITCRRRSSWAAAGSLRISTCFMPPTWANGELLQLHPGRLNKTMSTLDFAASGRVAGEVGEAVEQRARHFLRLAVQRGRAQSLVGPDRPPDRGQRVAEGGGSLGVPGRGARQEGGAAVQPARPQPDQGVEAPQRRAGAGGRAVPPME